MNVAPKKATTYNNIFAFFVNCFSTKANTILPINKLVVNQYTPLTKVPPYPPLKIFFATSIFDLLSKSMHELTIKKLI